MNGTLSYAFTGLVIWAVWCLFSKYIGQNPVEAAFNAAVIFGVLFLCSVAAYWFFVALGFVATGLLS